MDDSNPTGPPSNDWVDNVRSLDPIPLDGADVYPPELRAAATAGGWVDNVRSLDPIPLDGADVYPPELRAAATANARPTPPAGPVS